MSLKIISIGPYCYVHVKDTETNVVGLFCGPTRLTLFPNQQQIGVVKDMLVIKPNQHMLIKNPVVRDAAGEPVLVAVTGEDGAPLDPPSNYYKNAIGQFEYRHRSEFSAPFPLYPGEIVELTEDNLIVNRNESLEIEVEEDWTNPKSGTVHIAGETFMVPGPCVFLPAPEISVLNKHTANCIVHGQAIPVTASRDLIDNNGVARISGESYLYRKTGSYLPKVGEVFSTLRTMTLITEHTSLKLYSEVDHLDFFGKMRRAGDEWLVTQEMATEYILDIHEVKMGVVRRTILDRGKYGMIRNYIDDNGIQQWGSLKLMRGPTDFFLRPNEVLEGGVRTLDVLGDDQALLLFAEQAFVDSEGVSRFAGEKWCFTGPGIYEPSIHVKILDRRQAFPLGKGEGIYVKNNTTGTVRAQIGSTYMLKADEVLWEKELSPELEELYALEKMGVQYIPPKMVKGKLVYEKPDITGYSRVKHEVISYCVPFNRAVQLYDFKTKTSKVSFGPDLILLQPEEVFTVLSISGGRPKVENAIKSFSMMLGPDFMTDLVTVETADHAAIEIELAYGWVFEYNREDPNDPANAKLFSIKDFVGNACKSISSRIRGAISAVSYDEFHHSSSTILRQAVFGLDKTTGEIRNSLTFTGNNLTFKSCDIKSQRPVEKEIAEKLKQNTFLAIQIKTQATELKYRSEKDQFQQESNG
jgi:major vault protein